MKQDRITRVNRLLQTTLAELIPGQLKDPRVSRPAIISVVAVRTTPDLRYAKIYLSIVSNPEEQQAALDGLHQARGFLRNELARKVRLRYTPELQFVLDTTMDSAAKIEKILHELEIEKEQK